MNSPRKNQTTRHIIGLAGPIAAGKDLVATFLHEKGFMIIDVDKLGHIAIESSKQEIQTLFSPIANTMNLSLFDSDGSINRKNLAKIVFSKKKLLQKHEALLHPKMNRLILNELNKNPTQSYVINAAILHKFSVIKDCNIVLFVSANPFLRYKRAKIRNNISKMQFFKTFLSQIEIYSKCKKLNADIYKVNNSTTHNTLKQRIVMLLEPYI